MNDLNKEIEKALKKELYQAGLYLKKCILNQMDKAFIQQPKMYKRTGDLRNSLEVDNITDIKVNDGRLQIRLFFNEKAWHKAGNQIWAKNMKGEKVYRGDDWSDKREVNMAYYLNYGYKVRKPVWFKDIKNFGYREETLYIEKGIDIFNASNKWGMFIDKDKDIIVSDRRDFIR